jgi:hypothetical protein
MTELFAHVYQLSSASHLAADLNAFSVQNAHRTWHALIKNVSILALALVDLTPDAK